jgi:hypothetical protein
MQKIDAALPSSHRLSVRGRITAEDEEKTARCLDASLPLVLFFNRKLHCVVRREPRAESLLGFLLGWTDVQLS